MNRATICGRCLGAIGEHWSEQWPVYAKVIVGRHSCMGHVFPLRDHPAVTQYGAQSAVICWHNQDLPPRRWASSPWLRDGKWRLHWFLPWLWRKMPTWLRSRLPMSNGGSVLGPVEGEFGFHEAVSPLYKVPWSEQRRAEAAGEYRRSAYHLCTRCHDEFLTVLRQFLERT